MKKDQIHIYSEKDSFPNSIVENFYINYYQDVNLKNSNRTDIHHHTYYEIIWVEKGSGVHTIDFVDYHYSGPCLFLLHPRNVHKIQKNTLCSGGVIKFNDQFFTNDEPESKFLLKFAVFNDIDVFPILNLSMIEAKKVKYLFEIIFDETRGGEVPMKTLILSLLKSLLLKIYLIKKESFQIDNVYHPSSIRYQEFQELVERYFKDEHNLSFYSNRLKFSTRTLNEVCKKNSHKTAHQLIKDRLLLEAKRMLSYTDLSIKEIAFQLGFEDSAYFTRFFMVNSKVSPSEFRKVNS
ncbi:AraC family transcriptional regulator [Elizabethkingia sp. YR214]|uniref:helix-turn-helix domain-containing protein n=1 Tax=Elizabethkingia sp. YR214 TaxID=2135667 RepID=UPI000D303320|nr:helix-turn-helix domain-containing protein [Elizabethkingia sp. YR214]PUB34347.1 AraC family transcriptional regulator [Elizabethkingia sp. YR214]